MLMPQRRLFAAPNVAALYGGANGDANIANVVFLWGSSAEADGSTTFADESTATNKGAGTAVGNAQVDTAFQAFSGGSALFDGTGDYVTWPDHADHDLSNANSDLYTIEFWIKWNQASVSNHYVMGHAGAAGNIGWYLIATAGAANCSIQFSYSSNGNAGGAISTTGSSTQNLALNTWHYITVTKNASGKIRIWRNGTLDASATPADSSIFNSSSTFALGRALNTSTLNAALDEVRITKGVCRFDTDAAIAVPTAKFPRA